MNMKLSVLLDLAAMVCIWLAFFVILGFLASAAKVMFCLGYGC